MGAQSCVEPVPAMSNVFHRLQRRTASCNSKYPRMTASRFTSATIRTTFLLLTRLELRFRLPWLRRLNLHKMSFLNSFHAPHFIKLISYLSALPSQSLLFVPLLKRQLQN